MSTEIAEIAYKIYLHGLLPKKGIDSCLKAVNRAGRYTVKTFVAPGRFKKDFCNCYSVMIYGTGKDYSELAKILGRYKLELYAVKLFLYFKAVGSSYNGLPRLVCDFYETFSCSHQKVYIQPSARRNDFPMRERDQFDKEIGLTESLRGSYDLEGFYHATRGTTTMEHFMALVHAFIDVVKERSVLPMDLERVTIKEEQVHERRMTPAPKEETIIERRLFEFDPGSKSGKREEHEQVMEAFTTYLSTYLTPVVRSDAYVWDTDLGGVVYIEVERLWRNVLKKIDKYKQFLGDKPYKLIFYIPKKDIGRHKVILEESELKHVEVRYYDFDSKADMVVRTRGKGYSDGWFREFV